MAGTLVRMGSESSFRESSSTHTRPEGTDRTSAMENSTVDFIVRDAVSSGFLLKYCTEHYCDENMRFIVAIYRFRDYFYRDANAWPQKPWKQLDQEYDIITPEHEESDFKREFITELRKIDFIPETSWPSRIINREAVREALEHIWETYLSDRAKYEICIPYTALISTVKRIKLVHIYGREVFSEALIDPLKTIQRDIFPRFVLSEDYRNMEMTVKAVNTSACDKKLKIPKPPSVIFDRYLIKDIEENRIRFTLSDLIEDRLLYTEFSRYLEKCVSDENLKCIRAIQMYKEAFHHASETKDSIDRKTSNDYALLVYRYFVAHKAPHEISVSYLRRKEVMRGLADPQLDIFDHIEKSAMSALKVHYDYYILTKEFQNLNKIAIESQNNSVLPDINNNDNSTIAQNNAIISRNSNDNIIDGNHKKRSIGGYFRSACFPSLN